MILAIVGLFRTVPSALAPTEDQGYVFVIGALQDAAALRSHDQVVRCGRRRSAPAPGGRQRDVGRRHGPADVHAFKTNAGMSGCRSSSGTSVPATTSCRRRLWSARCSPPAAKVKDAMFFAVEPPPIEGLSNVGGFEMYIQSRGRGSPQDLAERRAEVRRGGFAASGAGGRHDDVQRQRAADAHRSGSREGDDARRAGDRGVRYLAEHVRRDVRE